MERIAQFSVITVSIVLILVVFTMHQNTAQAGITPMRQPAQDLEAGKKLFMEQCKPCHRADGKGAMEEMDLTDNVWRHGSTAAEIEKNIREGIKDTAMRAIMGEHS